jgi:hypothetical protein
MLVVDKKTVFSTFNDGVLGCTHWQPDGIMAVRAFRGHDDDGNMLRETKLVPPSEATEPPKLN